MDSGLKDLPQEKWSLGTGRQVILKGDFAKEQAAILQVAELMPPPTLEWVDATEVKIPATDDCPAKIMMSGFPNILQPGMVGGGLTDGRYRENIAEVTLDFDLSTSLWGKEKANQWYLVYARAGNADTAFMLKAMPMMRFSSQASQMITLRNNLNSADIGYGFIADELIGGIVYVLSGGSRGLMRAISANNNDNGTGGTITYGGSALTMSQGDWFVVLPPATNFRLIGTIFNNSSGDIIKFRRLGNRVQWLSNISCNAYASNGAVLEDIRIACPLAVFASAAAGMVGPTYASQLGHPDIPYSSYYILVGQSQFNGYIGEMDAGSMTFSLEFCRYFVFASSLHASYYEYPPGRGF